MITIKHKGDFKKTKDFFKRAGNGSFYKGLEQYAEKGVRALSRNTPKDSGESSRSWSYIIKRGYKSVKIIWTNSNTINGVPLVIMLQYGHGTKNGGYVQGYDFINPAIRPIFDDILRNVEREITK